MSVFDVLPLRIVDSMNIDGLASGSEELPMNSDDSNGAQTGQRPGVWGVFTVFDFESESSEVMHGRVNWFLGSLNFFETPGKTNDLACE